VEILNQILIVAFSPYAILLLTLTWAIVSACRYRLHALYQACSICGVGNLCQIYSASEQHESQYA